MTQRQGIPFRPVPVDPLADYVRGVTAVALAVATKSTAGDVARERYGGGADVVLKAVSTPASLADSSWASALAPTDGVGPFLQALRPRSAASRLFETALQVSLAGRKSVALPQFASPLAAPSWLGEGQVYPVVSGVLGEAILGGPKKLGFVTTLTSELAGIDDAEGVIQAAMIEAGAAALDASVFDNAPASAIRPAGLLNGLTPLPPTAGGGVAAMSADLANMASEIASAGGGAQLVLVASPPQALSLQMLTPGDLGDMTILSSAALPAKTAILLDPAGVASGFDGAPEIEVSKETLLHEDTAPGPISTPGNPNVVSAPVRSLWQTDCLAIKARWPSAWVRRGDDLIQFVEGTSW